MKRYFRWEYIKRCMDVFQLFVVVVGIIYSTYQITDIANNQLNRKNQLALMYYDKLMTGENRKIFTVIEHHTSISKSFTSDEIDNFLNDLDSVGSDLDRKLLDPEAVCYNFSYITKETYENREIKKYIDDARKEDELYFQGVDSLNNFLNNYCDQDY